MNARRARGNLHSRAARATASAAAMLCTDEPVWDIATFLLTAAVFWGAGLYVSKRVRAPYFSQIVRPWLFPSYVVYQLVLLIAQMLFAVGAYWVWLDGFWAAHTFALAMFVAALFIAFVSMFVTWVFFQPLAVFIGGIIMIVAGAAAIFSAIWMFFAVHYWAFAFALICAAVYVFFGILTIWLAIRGNSYVVRDGKCAVYKANAWPRPERDYDPCAAVVVEAGARDGLLDGTTADTGFVSETTPTPSVAATGREFLATVDLEVPTTFGRPPTRK